jgi:hypothetical protein
MIQAGAYQVAAAPQTNAARMYFAKALLAC